MAWIESHQDLEEHPKLLLLCQKTGWDIDQAIGKLHRLWWWTLKYAEDGDLSKYDPSQFLVRLKSTDNGKAPKELLEVLQECNFVDKDGKIHDWINYAGRYLSAKYRTSNPSRLKTIEKKYKSHSSRTKVGQKSATHLPNQPNQDNLTTVTIGQLVLKESFVKNKKVIYPMLDIEGEIRKCQDYWTGKGAKVRSWERAISNWLKRTYDVSGVVRKDDGDWTEKYKKQT